MNSTYARVADVLNEFDVEQLKKIYVLLFDVWCWDNNNESLKEIIDVLQQIIESPESIGIATPPESSLTHYSHGISNELFKFNYGSLSLGSELQFALRMYLEENLLSNSNGGITGVSIENQLMNFIGNQILSNPQITGMEAEIQKLRLELNILKLKVDSQE